MVKCGTLAVNSFRLAGWYFASNIFAMRSVLSDANSSSSTWNESSFVHVGIFHVYFNIVPAHGFGTELDVDSQFIQ